MKYILLIMLSIALAGCSDYNHSLERTFVFLKQKTETGNNTTPSKEISKKIFNVLSKRGFSCKLGEYINKCERKLQAGETIIIEIENSNSPKQAALKLIGREYTPFSKAPSKDFLSLLDKWREVILISGDTMLDYTVTTHSSPFLYK